MSAHLTAFVRAIISEDVYTASRCLSHAFTVQDGLGPEAFIAHEIEEFRQRLLQNERKPDILVRQQSENGYEICVVADGLVYATDFEVDNCGLINSNGNVVECVPKLRHHGNGIDRAAAVRSHDFLIKSITPKFPVLDCHLTIAPREGLFSYLHFSHDVDPRQTFTGSLRVMMKEAGSTNVIANFPGLQKFSDWQEKEFFPIIEGSVLHIPKGKSRPWSATVWLEGGARISVERPDPGFEWKLGRMVEKAMITDALDNDWVVEAIQ